MTRSTHYRLIPLLLAGGVLIAPLLCRGQAARDAFYAPAGFPPAKLPANGIYPHGRKLAFMGYSGVPARDLTNGFTIAGPVYGDQMPYLENSFAHGWPVIAHVGPRITFSDASTNKYRMDEPILREQVQEQVNTLAAHKEIVWWALTPEELRPWRRDEMRYLAIVCDVIRKTDPQHRPIYHYNPNHRKADTLAPIAEQVDILAKGCYVNHTGRKRDRAWVRWSIEQEIQAIHTAGRSNAIPLLMPELCKDPEEEGEDQEIRNWVRHDIYLGLTCGAKGILIWSLYPRQAVLRTWQLWYDAYTECAKELNGERGLAQVFLFGERRSDLKVDLLKGAVLTDVDLGGNIELMTTSEEERAKREVKLPAWTTAEFAYGQSRWLFLVNSDNAPARCAISGWPKDSRAVNAFDNMLIRLPEAAPLELELPAYGVTAIRFSKAEWAGGAALSPKASGH